MNRTDHDDFGAFVAHELSSPIMVMGMAAERLRRLLDDGHPEVVELVSVIERQAAHSSTLVSRMLELSRARRAPIREAFDLGDVAAEAASGIEGLHLDNRCWRSTVVADPLAVRQAVANLLANAARHGGGDATAWCVESPHGWRILVGDRGPGLDPTEAERLFRSFERGHRSDAVEGSGLGLAIVVAMAQAHDGRAGWTPRPGGGSVFWFTVPRT